MATLCSKQYSSCKVDGNSSSCDCDIIFYQCMLDAGCARSKLLHSLSDLCLLNSTQNISNHHPPDDRFMYNFGGAEHHSVIVLGLGFGLGDFSVRSRLGSTSCESTLWSSDSLITCKAPVGFGASHSIAVTLRRLVGTAEMAVSFDTFQLIPPPAVINRQTGSFYIEYSGYNLSTHVLSPAMRMGSTACELTEWSSITSISCVVPRGEGSSVKISFTASAQVSTISEIYSYDKGSISSSSRSNFVAESTFSTFQLSGLFELMSTSTYARISSSHTSFTHWYSDSSMSCKGISSVGSSMSLVISSSLWTSTSTDMVSYDTIQIERVRSAILHKTVNSYILETPSSFNPTDPKDLNILGVMESYLVPFSMPVELLNQSICFSHMNETRNLTNNSFAMNAFMLMYCKNESYQVPADSFNAFNRTKIVFIETSNSITYDMSANIRISQTASSRTIWTSHTALSCQVADGVGGSLRLGVTIGEQVGTKTDAVTYTSPRLQSALGQVSPGPAVGGGEVRLQGYGIGVADMSAMGRVWVSSCEGTEWTSDSIVLCKQAQGVGKELRVSVTSGSLLGTVGAGAAYAAPSVLYGVCSHVARETCNVNYTRCVESNNTEDGRCACEVSFADCLGTHGCADHSRMMAFQSTCPQNWTLYSGQVVLSELANASLASNRAGAGKRPAVTILGTDFGEVGYTIAGRAGVSACEATTWTSDSAVACSRAPGKGSSMAITMTVGEQVDTTMTSHSFDRAEMSSGRGVNVAGSGSMWTWVAGAGLGIWDLSARGRLGGSGSEATSWTSESAITCQAVIGGFGTNRISFSVSNQVSTVSSFVSFDTLFVSSSVVNLVTGTHFGLVTRIHSALYYTPSVSVGLSSMSSTFWLSQTSLSCKVSVGSGHSQQLVITTGVLTRSVSEALTFDHLEVVGLVSNNSNIFSRAMLSVGISDSLHSLSTIARLGFTASELTEWISASEIRCKSVSSLGRSHAIVVTTGMTASSISNVLSFDSLSLRIENNSIANLATLDPSHVIVTGQNMLAFSSSLMMRIGRSSAETSIWLSSSALTCRSSSLLGATLKLTATVSQGVGTVTECFSSDSPTIFLREASSQYCDYFRIAHCSSLRIDCNGNHGQCACDSIFAGCLREIGCTAHILVFQALFAAGCNDNLINPPQANPALLSTAQPRKQDIFGTGIGMLKSSASGRGGGTACERTQWYSDSALSLSTSAGTGGSKLIALTSMGQVGTLTNAYGYEDGKLRAINCSNLPTDAHQVILAQGVSLGLGSSYSVGSRLGRSSASATVWLSDSAILLKAVQGVGKYLAASITSGIRVGTSVNQFSFDEVRHQSYSWNANLTVSGKNFGYFDSSIMTTFGYTASEGTSWRSDSSIFCVIPYGIPDSSDVVATVLNQLSTQSQSFSYQFPELKRINVRPSCNAVQNVSNVSKCSEYAVAVGGGILSMHGASLGRSSFSVTTRSGGTACQASFWTSDTAVSCKLGAGRGVQISSLVTIIQIQSTAQDSFNFSTPCISSTKLTNGPPGGMQLITISGTNFGTADYSQNVAMKYSGSSCEKFDWTSDSSVTCLTHPGLGESIALFFIQYQNVSNCNEFSSHFTYDTPEALGISPSILPALAGDTYPKSAGRVTITGRNFGIHLPTSVEANVGETYCFDVFWIADTSIVAIVQPGEFLQQLSTKYPVQVTLEGRRSVILPNAVNFTIPTLTDVSIFSDLVATGAQTILHVRFLSTTQIPSNASIEFSYSVAASFNVQQPYKAPQVMGLDGNILLQTFTPRAFTDCSVLKWQMINDVSCTEAAICQPDLHSFCENRSGIPCSGKRNYSEAKLFCEKVGTRLCSTEELASLPLSYVSFCGYSSGDYIWTSTASNITNDQAEFFIISRNETSGQVQSVISSSTDGAHFVQCCSDYITSQIVILSREGYGSQVPVGQLVEIGIPIRLPLTAGKQFRSSLRITTANGVSIAIGTEIPIADVIPGLPDANMSTLIYLNDTYLASKSLRAGTNGHVKVLTRDVFGNVRSVGLPSSVRFSASFIGQGVGSTATSDSLDGILAVTYTATAAGRYGLSILLNDLHISGSPFQATVVSNDVNTSVSSISYSAGFSIGAVGTARQVTVIARDRYGNLISTSTQILFDLYVVRSLDSLQYLTVQLYPDNTTTLLVTRSGLYSVSVFYKSQLIYPLSPLNLSPGFTQALQTLILDNYGGVITDIVSFSIQARDEYGNDRTQSTDTWDITILNTQSQLTFTTTVTPSPTKGGLYIVEFKAPDVKMNLTASVKLSGKEVAGSPFTLIIVDEAGPADAVRSKVIGFSTDATLATRGTAGIPFSFTVQIRDFRGINKRSGGDNVSYSVDAGPKIRMNDLQNGMYNASIVRYIVGNYVVRIYLNQLLPIDKSPYNLTVVPAVPSGPISVVSGNGLLAITAGILSTFDIQSFDAFGNSIKYQPDQTPHVITSQLTGPSIVSVNIVYQTFLHVASYVVTRSGAYLLHILLSDGSKVGRSPYNITVFSNQPSSVTSRLYSKTASSTAGVPSTFAVDLRDSFGNNYISNLPYLVRVNVRRVCSADPCNPNFLVVAQQNVLVPFTYEVGLTLTISGNYLINSTLGGLNIVGSPLSFSVLPNSIDITKTLFSTTFSDFNIVQLGDRSNIVIVTRDKFSNNLTDGGQSFSASIVSSPTTVLITFNFQDFVNGTYIISWKPTDKGQYNLQLYWVQSALNGNLQFYVIPSATDPNLCVVQPAIPFFFVAGVTTTFSIQARDGSGSNKPDLFAFSKGWEKTETFMIAQYDSVGMMMTNRTCLFGSTTYDCTFSFIIAGSYTLKVMYGPQMANLPGSPRIIKVSPGPIVAQGCTYQALTVATAGSLQNFFIQTRDLYGNLGEYDPFSSNTIRFSIKVVNSLNIEIPCYSARGCMLNNLNGTFTAQTLLTQTGRYNVLIQLSGNNIRGSPADLSVTSSIVDLSKCSIQTSSLSGSILPLSLATAGTVQNMFIFLRDRYGNLAAENSVLDLSISKKQAFIGEAQTVITYSPTYQVADKAWKVMSSITRSGDWSLKVNVIINAASLPISGSPFSIRMFPDAVYAPSCYAEGTGLSSTAKTQTSIISIVQSDRYGNVITDGYSRFTWYINQGQKSDATFQGNGIYTFGYVLSSLGFYQLSIVLTETCVTPDSCVPDGRGIFKSPFRVECISNVGPVSPLESTMVGNSYMFRSADSVDPILVQTRYLWTCNNILV
eukprot:768777-Hanusia_phi.AAC.7